VTKLYLKGEDIGPGRASAVHGYYAKFNGLVGYHSFNPLYGSALSASERVLVLALTKSSARLDATGNGDTGATPSVINLDCHPGLDGRIDLGDSCGVFVSDDASGNSLSASVINCRDVPPIP
jgi:hypothetical protein